MSVPKIPEPPPGLMMPPPFTTTAPTVPLPSKVPPELTVIALVATLPLTWSVPALIVVPPVYVFEPDETVVVPVPETFNDDEPPIVPENVVVPELAMLSANRAADCPGECCCLGPRERKRIAATAVANRPKRLAPAVSL